MKSTHMTPVSDAARLGQLADVVSDEAAAAAESVRAICHATITRQPPLPAPAIYGPLADLASVGHRLHQALTQLGDHLGDSMRVYDVYQHDGGDPADATATAMVYLSLAATLTAKVGRALDQAHAAISAQGYRAARTSGRDDEAGDGPG